MNPIDKPHPCEAAFDDLINCNLTDAKRRAKRFTAFRLSIYAQQVLGWSSSRAWKAACYLKDECSFQEYCDAKED